MTELAHDLATRLNQDCACQFLDHARLCQELSREPALAEICPDLKHTHPHLFSASSVFITPARLQRMAEIVALIERISLQPVWQEQTLAAAPTIARHAQGARGGLLGFDFHLDDSGVQLIEVNTNPGGALLNVALTRAQRACCADTADLMRTLANQHADSAVLRVFEEEWRRSGRVGRPTRIAIVDEAPGTQYLYPEFLLYRHLFQQAGMAAVIADPAELSWREGALWHAEGPVDFVYNRLTDFPLALPAHAALRQAYEADAIVLSPHPRAHALYANKRNLALLSDASFLAKLPLSATEQTILLGSVPATEIVSPARAESLWARRRTLFFKPVDGFGSRAAYRGDKLTRRAWEDILHGSYVAQDIAPPSERLIPGAGEDTRLKLDLRAYAYGGEILLLAARLYSGQTTNFRTPGGGFAPVWVLPEIT